MPREVVCDLDGALCNFWRAIRADPEQVAYWADYPTIHQDLTARHRWLIQWATEQAPKLSEDPNYYDAKTAGWWVWGISLWIGPGWCQNTWDQRPHLGDPSGVSVQKLSGRPHMHNSSATGSGVSAQKQFAGDQIPHVNASNAVGQGVSAQRDQIPKVSTFAGGGGVDAARRTRPDLVDWFDRIAARLKGVIVLNRGWESALTPTVLMQTPSGPKPPVGILLDPPYLTEERSKIYGSDMVVGESNRVAKDSYEWALEHGDRYRVAYCCHQGDFPVPAGWTFETNTFGGIKDVKRFAERRDLVMFSPACVPSRQATLW